LGTDCTEQKVNRHLRANHKAVGRLNPQPKADIRECPLPTEAVWKLYFRKILGFVGPSPEADWPALFPTGRVVDLVNRQQGASILVSGQGARRPRD
jgi:hypothetical protein